MPFQGHPFAQSTEWLVFAVIGEEGIATEAEYDAALERVSSLMSAEPDSEDEMELDELAGIIEIYEDTHWPIEPPQE